VVQQRKRYSGSRVASQNRDHRPANLAELLTHANYLMSESFCDRLKAHGISAVEWRVLNALSADDGLKMTELAARVLFKLPTLTKVVDRMEEAQLVERRASVEDGRCAIARLTEHGHRVAAPLIAHSRPHEAAPQRMLGATATSKIKGALAELIDRLRHLPREVPAPRSRMGWPSRQATAARAGGRRRPAPAPSSESSQMGVTTRNWSRDRLKPVGGAG
jgi:MarR family transcriptional regulator, organic hydroperoxide resistance regulator